MLQIQHLTIRHKKDLRVLLEDFALTLNPGDKAALIGEEGNGKSTLLQWLAAPECIEDANSASQLLRGAVLLGIGLGLFLVTCWLSRVHLPRSSMSCTSDSSHSPFSVSVTVQDMGVTTPRPLPEKSVQSAGYTQIMGITSFRA